MIGAQTEVCATKREPDQQIALKRVRVLKLIDQKESILARRSAQDFGVLFQHLEHVSLQVIEIKRAATALLFVQIALDPPD